VPGTALADEGTPPPPPEPPPTETTPPPPPTVDAGPSVIQDGVTIGGQDVGGLTAAEARAAVEKRFARSLQLVVSKTWKQRVLPAQLGARARVGKAVETAIAVRRPGFAVPLTVEIDDARLERFLSKLATATRRDTVDSRLKLVGLSPFATRSVSGRRLKQLVAFYELRKELRTHSREPYQLPFDEIRPKVTETDLGKVIVIRRDSKKLLLFNGATLKRTFRVATGQSSYPTPLGRFEIVTKQRHPWWYPPQGSEWARGKEPVPPGPGNPLGTRWMGISAPLVGIHGTPDAASIGYSASHGCIRMLIPQVEWLFERVEVGTPVFIVPA
jgi:hypothetical protein